MSASRNNNDQLLIQQIAMLKQVTNKNYKSGKKRNNDSQRYQKFFSSQSNIPQNLQHSQNVNSNHNVNLLNQSYNENINKRDSSLLKKKDHIIIADKIFLPQNINSSAEINANLKSSKTPEIAAIANLSQSQVINQGLYQQIKNKNPLQQNHSDLKMSQQLKGSKIESDGKKAVCKFQQPSAAKKFSREGGSGRNSTKNVNNENFFNQRNGGQTKESIKQVINIYKEKDDTFVVQPARKSMNDANIKGSMAVVRNLSVPRQAAKNSMSSQDYTNMPNVYKDSKPIQNLDKIKFSRTEALNNSTGNIKLNDLSFPTYGQENLPLRLDETQKQSALLNNGQQLLQQVKAHSIAKQKANQSIIQGMSTMKTCTCPCQCQQNNQDTQSQTNNMMSILSQNKRNHNINTMTLRFGQGFITTTGGQSTTVMMDEPSEAQNMEEMHYLMINVEKIKKNMLGKVEGLEDPNIDYEAFYNIQLQQKNNDSDSPDRGSLETNNLNVVYFE